MSTAKKGREIRVSAFGDGAARFSGDPNQNAALGLIRWFTRDARRSRFRRRRIALSPSPWDV
jgi:hypothetical protein